ncbi:MAG TPA: lysozyme inhibitor LprI family protein [Pelomicrobium sp.]|nr:lysozyme inhibitor LprI family protein [Pelomicrobium sp.]
MTAHPSTEPVRLTHADQILLEMAALVFIFGMAIVFFRIAASPPVAAAPPAPAAPVLVAAPLPESAGHACETQASDLATLTACLEAALVAERDGMDAAYRDLTRLAPGAEFALARSQVAWVDFTRADCELQAQPFAGTPAQRVMSLNCEYVKTAARTRALATLADELREVGGGDKR